MPRPPTWRDRLYECPTRDFPLFARLRLVQEQLAISIDRFRELALSPRGHQTFKNILAGNVVDHPQRTKGWSRIEIEEVNRLVASLKELGYGPSRGLFLDRMTEPQFLERIASWPTLEDMTRRSHAGTATGDDNGTASLDPSSEIPSFDTLRPAWTEDAKSLWRELDAWIAGRHTVLRQPCIGVCAPSGFGKTASIASWAAQLARQYEVVWLHCTRYPTYEFLIDAVLLRLAQGKTKEAGIKSVMSASTEEKLKQISIRLAAAPTHVFVVDSLEYLLDHPGTLRERPRDQLIVAFLRDYLFRQGTKTLVICRHVTRILNELVWIERSSPLWLLSARPAPLTEQLGAQRQTALGRAVMAPQSVNKRDAFPADEIVEGLLESLDSARLQLFTFMVLIGEEVRLATLRWYSVNHLQIPDAEFDDFIQSFWMDCQNAGAVATKTLFRTFDDPLDHQTDYEWQVHYKFHDSIVSHAARLIEQRASEETRLTHLKIAERAHDLMHRTAPYAGKATAARFARPAQVVKHILASIPPRAVAAAWQSYEDSDYMLKPGRRVTDDDREAWRATGSPFAATLRVEDAFLYCFDDIYRGVIDSPRDYNLSRDNGADRAKLDLLLRFFQSGNSLDVSPPDDITEYPLLPVDLLCELLTSIAVAALNAGVLIQAQWGVTEALRLLTGWKSRFDDNPERRRQVAFAGRVHVDILMRGGNLRKAEETCRGYLKDGSDFLDCSTLDDRAKLKIRLANVIFLQRGITEALEYLAELGLDATAEDEFMAYSPIDLTGQSGRIWVSLLLRTLKGRPRDEQLAIFRQARLVHQRNWEKSNHKANERVALQVEASILDRVSEQAIRDRQVDLIDADALARCRQDLLEVRKLAWKRGVSPATRLDLEFELARIMLLEGKYDECLTHANELTSTAQRYGYRLYEYDAILLRCEALWAKRQFEDAERLFYRLLEIERETGYKAHHQTRLLIQYGVQPSRRLVV